MAAQRRQQDYGGAADHESTADEALIRDLKRQARATPTIGSGQERVLLERAALGDRASLDRLVAANLGKVIRLAEERGEQGLSTPDLVQEGSLGLVEAVRSFADSGDPDFDAFATRMIGAQMDAAIAAEAAAIRDAQLLVAAAGDYERIELALRRELRRPPTEKQIAVRLEWSVDRTRYVAQVVADARRRHDEELLEFIDPEALDVDGDSAGGDSLDE